MKKMVTLYIEKESVDFLKDYSIKTDIPQSRIVQNLIKNYKNKLESMKENIFEEEDISER